MTVDELIKKLQEISDKGRGNYHIIHNGNDDEINEFYYNNEDEIVIMA